MKDEYGGKSILEFVGLKPKMYSILDESNNEKSANRGLNTFIEFQEFTPTKLIKYLYHVLMIKDIFSEMELKHLHMNIKTYKND